MLCHAKQRAALTICFIGISICLPQQSFCQSPLRKGALLDAWAQRSEAIPAVKVKWEVRAQVNSGTQFVSPFDPAPQAESRNYSLRAADQSVVIRDLDICIRYNILNNFQNEWRLDRREASFLQDGGYRRYDAFAAQGMELSKKKQIEILDEPYSALELNFRPMQSPVASDLAKGAAVLLPTRTIWAGQEAYTVAYPVKNAKREHYFDAQHEYRYLGYHYKTSEFEGRFEVRYSPEYGSAFEIQDASTTAILATTQELQSRLVYEKFQFDFSPSITDQDFYVQFPDGTLLERERDPTRGMGDSVIRPDSQYDAFVVADGESSIEPLRDTNKHLLDPIHRGDDMSASRTVPLIIGLALLTGVFVIWALNRRRKI